jgi:CRP-like cAMP-binding protein
MVDVTRAELQQIFPGVRGPDLDRAAELLPGVAAEPGELLIAEGGAEATIIAVVEGTVEIIQDGIELSTAGPGELIGEMALFGARPRAATVRASTACRLFRVTEEQYVALCAEGNRVAYVLERLALEQLGARRRRANDRLTALAEFTPSPWSNVHTEPTWVERVRRLFHRESRPSPLPTPVHLDVQAALRAAQPFAHAPDDHLAQLAPAFEASAYPKHHVLYREGEAGDRWFLIVRGEAERYVTARAGTDAGAACIHRIGTAGPGTALGLTSLLDGRSRMISCIATRPTTALTMRASTFRRLIASDSPEASLLRQVALRAMIDQLAQANATVVAMRHAQAG